MNRRTFLLSMAGAAGCSPRGPRRLNVYNWSDYIAPETIPEFEREHSARVRYGTFESVEEMLAKVAAGNSGWDVAVCTNSYIQPLSRADLLAPLRHSWLPNLAHLHPEFQRPPWDPELRWGVPYLSSSTGIGYNIRVPAPPSAWSDLWLDRYQRRTTLLDDPNDVIGATLLRLGLPVNSADPEHLRRARDAAIEVKRIIRGYLNSEVKDQMISGELLVAQMWASTAQLAIDANPELRFVHPREGFPMACDIAVVLAESRRAELAHRFLDFILRPAVGARIASAARGATPNAAAFNLLPEAARNSPVLYPPAGVLARGQWLEPLTQEGQRRRDRIWTEIKSA